MATGLAQGIYDTGADLINGVTRHDPNQFGRGLSRIALSLGNVVMSKLGIKAILRSRQTLGNLRSVSAGEWESSAGLRYGHDPNYGNRVQHVLRLMQ